MFRAVLLALLTLALPSAHAQTEPELAPDEIRDSVASIADLFAANYHDRPTGEVIRDRLLADADTGAFDSLASPDSLSARLSSILVQYDRHAGVTWSASDEEVEAHHSDDWPEFSRRLNHGIERFERLPGNVALLRLRMLPSSSFAGETMDGAMRLMENAEAVILDLRANGGGEPDMVEFVASYFLGPEPVQISSIYWADRDEVETYWTSPTRPDSRLHDLPLYILTTAATGSAAEGLAQALKDQDRAILIGQHTYGAGNPGRFFRGRNGFQAFVSYGRPGDAHRDQSWEGHGVIPHITTEAGAELDTALDMIWAQLSNENPDDDQMARLDWALTRRAALADPVELTREQQDEFVADYGDRQTIRIGEDIYYVRGRRAPLRLVPAGNDRFYVEEFTEFRIDYIRDENGRIIRMDVPYNDGHTEPNLRD